MEENKKSEFVYKSARSLAVFTDSDYVVGIAVYSTNLSFIMSKDSGKAYHKECTGIALQTVQSRQVPADITLFGSCFCPFVQR